MEGKQSNVSRLFVSLFSPSTHRPPLRRNRKTLQHARRRGLWGQRVVLKSVGRVGFRRASGAPPRLSVPFGRPPFSLFFDRTRAALGRRARTRGSGPQSRRMPPASSGLALESQLLIFRPLVTPRPQTCGCAATTHFFGSKARPRPARRSHAHTRGCGGGRDRPRSACGLPSLPHPAPSPCLTSCTPRKVRRTVWRTHTHSGLPRARGGDEAASTAAKARV